MENENWFEILQRVSKLQPERLVISGGEPLLDDKLIEKLSYISDAMQSTDVSLSTNAAVDFDFAKLKGLIGCIDISLPSLDADVFSEMRGMNCVSIVKRNIEKCLKYGFNVRLSCILTKPNKAGIMDVLDFAQRKGVSSVRLGRYLPFRYASNCRDDFELSEEEIREIMSEVNKKAFSFKIIPPIGDLSLISSGYITVDYMGNLFFPKEDGKDVVFNILDNEDDKLIHKVKELCINDVQSLIFTEPGHSKYDFRKYFVTNRIRQSGDYSIIDALYSDRSRIIFSSPFRRLQQKAQVFSLEDNSNVRSRLTHSLEVADAGRRIAGAIVERINSAFGNNVNTDSLSYMITTVENACLLHDLGNPPFGHFGEKAIQIWWANERENYIKKHDENANTHNEPVLSFSDDNHNTLLKDFEEFDGNPQGLRIALRLYNIRTEKNDFQDGNLYESGFNLTYSTILCALKYTRTAGEGNNANVSGNLTEKAGYFNSERRIIEHMRKELDLGVNSRYPFTYIMEAADDIAYFLSDISDGFEKQIFSKKELVDLLYKELERESSIGKNIFDYDKLCELIEKKDFDFNYHISVPWANAMVEEVAKEFVDNIENYLCGSAGEIINSKSTPNSSILTKVLKGIRTKYLYRSSEAESIELAGYSIITGLLRSFGKLLELTRRQFDDFAQGNYSPKKNSLDYEYRLFNRLSKRFVKSYLYQREEWAHYGTEYNQTNIEWWLRVHLIVDHISSMTDEYALRTFQTCEGIDIKML